MALSGSFIGTTNNQYIQPKITWSATQDIAGNFSTVTATLTYSRTNSGYTTKGKWSGSITINRTTTNYSTSNTIVITQNSNTVAMTATVKVPHDNDGKKSVYISCTGGMTASSISLKTTSCASTITLDTIPRQATITSASDFTDLDNPTIYFSNPANCPMDVWLEPNPVGDHLCVRNNISNTGSYTWTLTDAEREQLRNNCTGKTSCTIRLGLYSTVGGITYADYKDKTFTMTDNAATKPSVTINHTLNNGSLSIIFANMYIQGKSRLDINLTAEGKYGADITNYSVSVDGKTYYTSSFTTDVITKSGDVDIIASVKDTRGFTGTATHTIENVLAYSKPLVVPIEGENAILCYRSDGNGLRVGNSTSVWVKAKRSYYNLLGKNQCILQWRRRLISETTWDAWKALIKDTDTTDEYNGLIIDEVFELDKSYAVQIRVADEIGEDDIKEFEIPTQDVALHLGAGGKNVAVGTYCDYSEPYTFYSAWKAIFDEGALGTLLNYNVADVLEFSVECAPGITPIIITDETNKESLPIGNYAYSVGIVHKGTADRCNVILFDYMSGKIAINVHLSDGWIGWKYITPQ